MKILNDNWLIFDDEMSLSKVLAQEILNIAKKSIFEKDCFSIVLTGGQSVLSLYKILSKADSNWNKWHIYIGDERCLPVNHKDRNNHVINETWLNNSPIPKRNIHFIQAEMSQDKAQLEYESALQEVDKFDVVLLSMGEDGHVASLFPNHRHPKNRDVVVENDSPKSPKKRISLSYERLNKSYNVFKVIIGEVKREAVALLIQGRIIPISKIIGDREGVYICENAIPKS